jgi:hypothetical protein
VFKIHHTTWLFSKEYRSYLNKAKTKTLDDVSMPRRFNGTVISDFDDYEQDVITKYQQTVTE